MGGCEIRTSPMNRKDEIMSKPYPYNDLKNTSNDELVMLHDLAAESSQAGTNYYLAELRHRELVGEMQVISMRLKAMVGQLSDIAEKLESSN